MTSYMALPGPERDPRADFQRSLTAVLDLLGITAPPSADFRAQRLLVKEALRDRTDLPEAFFAPLLRAAVDDPDPSFDRWFVDPARLAFGRARVMEALLHYLVHGTDSERAGAARAWYWVTRLRRGDDLEPFRPFASRWLEAALHQFVTNEDLEVRRCLLADLPLNPRYYRENLHEQVHQAVHIARTHPDPYLRNRVEHQV
ncbi:hypothetical protein [Actinocrispum sp. NPDC049592]|uniref:hypothetical protein n=1 Tax=Actinocrispum sp. NPDC049592 TaxID=3154835 RepID=UPI003448CA57